LAVEYHQPASLSPSSLRTSRPSRSPKCTQLGWSETNGTPGLTISVSKSADANTVSTAQDSIAAIEEFAAAHSAQVKHSVVTDSSIFIIDSIEALVKEGGLGAAFAVVVIFVFLLNLRSTIVAAVSIPLSVLADDHPHVNDRHHHQHHDPGRPRRSGWPRGGRLHCGARKHLSTPQPRGTYRRSGVERHARGLLGDHQLDYHDDRGLLAARRSLAA